jgi:hypothetical protein
MVWKSQTVKFTERQRLKMCKTWKIVARFFLIIINSVVYERYAKIALVLIKQLEKDSKPKS